MKTLIVAGGTLDIPFLQGYLDSQAFDYVIACDRGIHFFTETARLPDEILGDFDSADAGELEGFRANGKTRIHTYPVQKDETDTELALMLALDRGSTEIHIAGATGTRLDHMLGSIRVLGRALERRVPCYLVDAHNRLRLADGTVVLKKKLQYGSYVSLIPLTTKVSGVTLTGFLYNLSGACLGGYNSLGVSNEIVASEAVVTIEQGVLIVIESKD